MIWTALSGIVPSSHLIYHFLLLTHSYLYFPKKAEWRKWGIPQAPPPRSGHQAVALSRNGGQIWVFGGECSSPNGSISRHYGDLWVLHLAEKRWEEIKVRGGPQARSGERVGEDVGLVHCSLTGRAVLPPRPPHGGV